MNNIESKLHDTNVNPATGKLSTNIRLFSLQSPHNLSFNLDLSYQSNLLKSQYETWALENTSGIVATGWSISCGMRIIQLSINPSILWLNYYGTLYELRLINTTKEYKEYRTKTHSNLNIKYYSGDYWVVTGIDGNRYYFGYDNQYSNEEGKYDFRTGSYSDASKAYLDAREKISNIKAGLPENGATDNTICSSKELVVAWNDNWIGPSISVNNQRHHVCCWNLTQIEDAFSNVFSFSYIQHISNVCKEAGSLTYTVASYLYRLRLFVRGVESESLFFYYDNKDTSEYSVDLTLLGRPNGMQQKFEKLHLIEIEHVVGGHSVDKAILHTSLEVPTAADSSLSKRQLTEVSFVSSEDPAIQYQPGYVFTYYGEADGVNVGTAGFDSDHPYHIVKSGALYGHLKSITYPSGEVRSYEYSEIGLSNVGQNLSLRLGQTEKQPTIIHTPYNYSIVIRYFGYTVTIAVCTWTLTGWKYQELISAEAPNGYYDVGKSISYSYHMIGFITPDLTSFQVFTRDYDGDGVWSNYPFRSVLDASAILGGITNTMAIAVDESGVAITCQSIELITYVWFYETYNDGRIFVNLRKMPLTPLFGNNPNYRLGLCIANGSCYVFALLKEMERIRPANFKPASWLKQYPDIERDSLSVGIIAPGSTNLAVIKLGKIPCIINKYAWDSNTASYKGITYIGGQVTNVSGVLQNGQMLSIRIQTTLQWTRFQFHTRDFSEGSSNPMPWGIDLILSADGKSLRYLVPNDTIETRDHNEVPIDLYNITVCSFSSQMSGNGAVYQYYYTYQSSPAYAKTFFRTIFESYDGNTVIEQIDSFTPNLLCFIKNDIFAAFQTIDNNLSRKTYFYYNQGTKRWNKIQTGTISQEKVTYNNNASTAVKIMEYLGMALYVIFLPLGLGSVSGLLMTLLSISMMVSSYIAQAVLTNSARATLNLPCAFMGNRFINDGTTIWFRDSDESNLTAIGSGIASQPYDILSGDNIIGNVYTDRQQFGTVYNYVPFFTDKNRIYFRRLKNKAVGIPCSIGGLSEGCDDLYYNVDGKFIAFSGPYKLVFNSDTVFESKSLISDEHPYFTSIDACATLYNSYGDGGNKLITISGPRCCITCDGITTPPENIADAFVGSHFTFVDAALEVDRIHFYLFSGNRFEIVEMRDSGFFVTSAGTLQQYIRPITLKSVHAACQCPSGTFYFSGNSFQKYHVSYGIVEEGILGSDRFYEEFNKDSNLLDFNSSTLSVYKTDRTVEFCKFINGKLSGSYRDYVVSKVHVTSSPSENGSHELEYAYSTENAAFSESINSGIYKETYIGMN